MNDKKYYITTSIPYMNSTLHAGHAYELVLADFFARYHREKGEKTFFLTGSDEHGDKIIASAQKEGLGPQAFVNNNVASFKKLLELLTVSNDAFIRTSDEKAHWPGAQKLWRALEASGDPRRPLARGLPGGGGRVLHPHLAADLAFPPGTWTLTHLNRQGERHENDADPPD